MTARLSKPSVAVILLKRYAQDQAQPVVLRLTFRGARRYFTIGSCLESDWNHHAGRYKSDKEGNLRISALEVKAQRILKDFEDSERAFTFDRFAREFFVDSGLKMVLKFIEEEIQRLTDAQRAGSLMITKTVKNSLSRFRNGRDFSFIDLDLSFLERWEAFLLKSGCSLNGVAVYMRQLKAIYNRAISRGLVKRQYYPFDEYRIKTEVTRKRALTKEQMEAIIAYPVEEGTSIFHSKNYFLFSFFTRGMNFADLSRLKAENIINNRIEYVRAKTKNARSRGDGRAFSIPIRDKVKEIVAYYRKNHFDGVYLFPILGKEYASRISEKYAVNKKSLQVNRDLQTICRALGIPSPEMITFYSARHTWATLTKRAGGSTELIQEGLGHGNVKTTEVYLAQFANEDLDKADSWLDDLRKLGKA